MTITDLYGALAPLPGGRWLFGAAMAGRIAWRNIRCSAVVGLCRQPGPVGRWGRGHYAAILRRWRADVLELETIAAGLSHQPQE